MVRTVSEHVTRANAVYLLHLLHESVWSELSDVVNNEMSDPPRPSPTPAPGKPTSSSSPSSFPAHVTVGDAERVVLAHMVKKAPFLYSLLASKANRAVNYALNSVQSQERNKLFVYQLIHMITYELKRP